MGLIEADILVAGGDLALLSDHGGSAVFHGLVVDFSVLHHPPAQCSVQEHLFGLDRRSNGLIRLAFFESVRSPGLRGTLIL